ncbi:MAG TPA: hypothetical protein VJS92_00090 [Candidatus Polarisedimenticolaceae bacterium]|nr:hypothetical protein [Candidatus Polarisedimenticolaceae bacterium]
MSQKYRHHGYRDSDWSRDGERPKPAPGRVLTPEERIQQRSLRHAIDRDANEVLRCHNCGRGIPAFGTIAADSVCPHCQAPLHCCRTCRSFDSAARWQCRAEITEQIADKSKANACPQYAARLVLDVTGRRSASGNAQGNGNGNGGSRPSNDPRSLFENLFKR